MPVLHLPVYPVRGAGGGTYCSRHTVALWEAGGSGCALHNPLSIPREASPGGLRCWTPAGCAVYLAKERAQLFLNFQIMGELSSIEAITPL